MKKFMFAILVSVVFTTLAFAGDDQDSYCKYVLEQGAAQQDLLRTPDATAGFVQPNTGQPAQALTGASISLSNLKKSGLTMDVARKNCELYRSTTAVQQQIQYALPTLEKAALKNRLELDDQAANQLDAMIADSSKLLQAKTSTLPMLYSLHSTKVKLFKDKSDTALRIAVLFTLDVSNKPVRDAVTQKQADEIANQKAVERLTKQNNWDVAVDVGARHQITPLANDVFGPYATLSLTYNLASRAIDRHLASAVTGYTDWKLTQEGDVVRNAIILQKDVTNSIAVEETQLSVLQEEMSDIESNLKIIENVDTSAALSFRNQLLSDRLILRVEVGDVTFRLAQLKQYLADNF